MSIKKTKNVQTIVNIITTYSKTHNYLHTFVPVLSPPLAADNVLSPPLAADNVLSPPLAADNVLSPPACSG